VNSPLTQLLRTSPQFELAYEDKVAVVFVARHCMEQPLAGGWHERCLV
jgi:hypothetical protein